MREIELSQNQVALVDEDVFTLLSEFKWCYRAEREGRQGYAVRHTKVNGKDRLCYLHRLIMEPQPGFEVIFKNYDRLDCRRENLQVVTKQEARQHHRVRRDSQTGTKGVRYQANSDSWVAAIYRDGHCRQLGLFYSKEAAELAYEKALSDENPALHRAPAKVDRPPALPWPSSKPSDAS